MNTMAPLDLSRALDALRGARRVVLTTHIAPDGDAVGSLLGLRALALALGAEQVDAILPDPAPRLYDWLPGVELLGAPESAHDAYDLAVLVDASHRDRAGRVGELLARAPKFLVIDHHADPHPEGDITCVDSSYAAAGELVAELFDLAQIPMDSSAAQALYVAIATDTGGFRFSNTNARTHRIAARLLESEFDVAAISQRLFDQISWAKLELTRRMLDRMDRRAQGRLIFSEITAADVEESCATDDDFEGLVNILRNVTGVELAILFRELAPERVKLNLRSRNGINCAVLARQFGGGGHAPAAGATIECPLENARAAVLVAAQTLFEEKQ